MRNTTSEAELDAALSMQALDELSAAYARGLDRADEELLASLFHPDSTVVSGIINGSGSEFARQMPVFLRQNLERCWHSVANSWFQVAGDSAVGEVYVLATMTAGGNDVMTGGRYIDSYHRREGVWKFSSRTFVMDWTTSQPANPRNDAAYAAFIRGCFGREDPVYRLLK